MYNSALNMSNHQSLKQLTSALFILLGLLSLHQITWAEASQWQLQKDGKITVYTRYIEGEQLKAFKVSTQVKSNLASMLTLLADTDAFPDWFFMMKGMEVIREPNAEGETYVRLLTEAPWPVKDRDAIIKATLTQNPQTQEITIIGVGVPQFYPEQKGFVRMPTLESSWRLTPLADGMLEIEMIGHANPGGAIPKWLANLAVTVMPTRTMKNIHKMLAKEKYQISTAKELQVFGFDLST